MADKVYLRCSIKARQTQFGEVLNLGIKVEDLAEFCRKHKNERGYLNLTISRRREVGQYGDTHSVSLDTYKPKQAESDPSWERGDGHNEVGGTVTSDDIPF